MSKLFIPFVIIIVCVFTSYKLNGQNVGIGTSSPNPSAQLDVQSTDKGFLPPRMTGTQRKAITSPAAGLVVFDTDASQLFLFDGTAWLPLNLNATSTNITPAQTIPAAEVHLNSYFGVDVAMGDNYAVVGAPFADSGSKAATGAIYIYSRLAVGGWQQITKLHASDAMPGARFGASVATAGNYIVVGAPYHANKGKVYVFTKGTGNTWTETATITRPAGTPSDDYFGNDVAISTTSVFGAAIVVGAPRVNIVGNNAGAVYTYRLVSGAWTYEQIILPGDLSQGDFVGYEVAIDGDYLVAGAPYQNYGATLDAGAAYIYVYGGGAWNFQQKLFATTQYSAFGQAFSINGNRVAVGAPNAPFYGNTSTVVSIYERTGNTWTWKQELYLQNTQGFDVNNRMGASLALDSSNLLVGLPGGIQYHNGDISFGNKPATVHLYKKNDAGNFYLSKAINDNEPIAAGSTSLFGNAVSIKNGQFVIGAPFKTVNGYSAAGGVAFGYTE